MAWRIDEHVVRGEIDNRCRGRVTGRIWCVDRTQPIELNLDGNAWRDLAGRRLEFTNPSPKPGLHRSFTTRQVGQTGDITASRKVRVPEIPLEQIGEYYLARKPFPWHWGNGLYLEWVSASNGRVVIESTSYQLTVSPEIAWEMTIEEEIAQHTANAAALDAFMLRLTRVGRNQRSDTDDTARPQTEAEAERMQAESDRLVDRIVGRMEHEGDDADYEKIVDEEVHRARRERGEPDLTPEQDAELNELSELMNAAAAEALDDEKSESWRDGDAGRKAFNRHHPLSERALELSVRIVRESTDRDWLPEDALPEHPVLELFAGVSKAGAKLAGALDDDDWPPSMEFCATTIVRLKKATGYLEDAQLSARSCREESLTEPTWLEEVAAEVAAIGTATAVLIEELRARLKSAE